MLLNADKKLSKPQKNSSKRQAEEVKGGDQTAQLQSERSEHKKTDFFSTLANSGKAATQLMAFDEMANGSSNDLQSIQKEKSPVEAKPEGETAQLAEQTAEKPNNTGLPNELKSGVEQLSGVSMEDVKVNYNSNKPAQLSAHAYAQGSDIHVASGQEKHVPHEAWHVAQQKKGRVQPTTQLMGSIPVNDDKKLETEADVMGAKALQTGRSNAGVAQAKGIKDATGSGSDTFQLVQKLNLEGTQTLTSKFKGLFSVFGDTETTHTKLQKEVEKFNAAKTDDEQQKLKPEIIRLGKEWLAKNASKVKDKSEDRNEKTKRISIEKILQSLESSNSAEPTAPVALGAEADKPEALAESPKTEEETAEEDVEENEAEREVYNKDQEEKVEKYKEGDDYHSAMPGGFIGVMKGKLIDIVKDVQGNEGSLQQADNYISGDAAVNTFFANQLGKAKGNEEELQKLNTHADSVYRGAFKGKVMKDSKLQESAILAYKKSSLSAARVSKRRIQETAADRVIVEMYYNQLEKLKDGEHNKETNKDAADIYKFAKARKFEVTKRKEKAAEQKDKLMDEERVNSKTMSIITSIGYGAAGAAFKIVTLGMGNMKKNLDKRGFNSKEDFTVDTDTEEATNEKFESRAGYFDLQGPLAQMGEIKGEFDAKMDARKGMGTAGGIFSALSLGLEAGKRFLGFVKGIFSSLGIWSGLLTAVAPPMAAVAAWCGTISYYIGLVMSSITVLRGLLNGVAQMMNDNPALFSELAGETKKSAVSTFTEGGSFAVGTVGINIAREKITGEDKFQAENLIDPSKMLSSKLNPTDGPELSMTTKIEDMSTQAGGVIGANALIGGAANAGLSNADKSMANNNMKYNQSINKNRRIGKDGRKTASAGSAETKLIEESYATTKEKASKSGAKLIPLVKKFSKANAPSTTLSGEQVNEKDKENNALVPAVSEAVTGVAGELSKGLEEIV